MKARYFWRALGYMIQFMYISSVRYPKVPLRVLWVFAWRRAELEVAHYRWRKNDSIKKTTAA